jgi:RNA polymerase-binding transcription factor DksA
MDIDGHDVINQTTSDQAPGQAVAAPAEETGSDAPEATRLDLDGIERDLADVEAALARLDAGTYWTDEVTGATIPDETLAANPVTRRA